MDKSKSLKLIEDEELVESLKPHPLAFLDFYVIFSYMMLAGGVFVLYRAQIVDWLEQIDLIGLAKDQLFVLLWGVFIAFPFLALAILKITWRWFFFALIMVVAGIVIVLIYNLPPYYMQLPSILAGAFGFVFTEFYRRGHTFYITNLRIISELSFLSYKKREMVHGKIVDLVLTKGLLGRLFNYGTIFPITASGFGLGADLAAVTAGIGAAKKGVGGGVAISGGRNVSVPRGRSSYVLFGIRRPDEVYMKISEYIHGYEEAPYLKKILEELKSKKDQDIKG
ncbi:MAG: PH domain-containing protein [Nitrososphaerales archaeon]|nr:PH domain-containing protein [Nitrososphaerales archaeon]